MSIDSLEIDEHGYPSEEAIAKIVALKELPWAEHLEFMQRDFWDLATEMSDLGGHGSVWDDEDFDVAGVRRVVFATGGWSGCEEFIHAVLSLQGVNTLCFAAWERGGKYTFEWSRPAGDRA